MKKPFEWLSFFISFTAIMALVTLVSCSGSNPGASNSLSQIQKRGKMVVGVKFDSKPFGYLDQDGKLKGYDVDLMRLVAKKLLGSENSIEFEQVLSSTRIIALNQGTLDVVAATMTITPEREGIIDFSDEYFKAGQAVMVPIKSSFNKVDDLKNKRILFVLGTTSEKTIKNRLPNATYIGFKSTTDAFSALKAGRGDALTTDDTILAGFIGNECQFKLLPERLSSEPYGLGFKQDAQNSTESLRLKINEILKEFKTDGTLARLKTKWMSPYEHTKACPPNH